MSDRIANIIVLGEDQEHQNLVRRYLLRCGHDGRSFRFVALPGKRGAGEQHVRNQFPDQVRKCRETLGRARECMLIVVTNADSLSTGQREQTLLDQLVSTGQDPIAAAEPIVILIPKWQVETWIKCLLGQAVKETDKNTDRPEVSARDIADAAATLFEWARPNAQPGPTCVASLLDAIPRWRRIC